MAATLGKSAGQGARIFSARWMLSQLLSFEAIFVLFLYSNEIKILLPPLPVDETVFFGALSMGVGAWLLSRQGLYLPGLVIVGTAFLFVVFALVSSSWTPSKVLLAQRLSYLLIFNMWCVISGALIIASSRARTLRFLCLVLAISLFVALSGLWIYLIYGNFRSLFHMWGGVYEYRRMYLNWGYTVADGTAVAVVIGLYSRFMSLKQLALFGCFAVCATFLLVGGARPVVGRGLGRPCRDLRAHPEGGTRSLRGVGGTAGRSNDRGRRRRLDRDDDRHGQCDHDAEPLHPACRPGGGRRKTSRAPVAGLSGPQPSGSGSKRRSSATASTASPTSSTMGGRVLGTSPQSCPPNRGRARVGWFGAVRRVPLEWAAPRQAPAPARRSADGLRARLFHLRDAELDVRQGADRRPQAVLRGGTVRGPGRRPRGGQQLAALRRRRSCSIFAVPLTTARAPPASRD